MAKRSREKISERRLRVLEELMKFDTVSIDDLSRLAYREFGVSEWT